MKKQIIELLTQAISELGIPSLGEMQLEHPAQIEHGEWSSNVALIGIRLQDSGASSDNLKFSNPRELAQAIVDVLQQKVHSPSSLIRDVQVAGPGFINFYLSDKFYQAEMGRILEKGGDVVEKRNIGKKGIVEFSSPNIAKPFTIGHLRSTIIGDAVANLLEETGYDVLRDNHLGDWGTQFGKLIVAIKKWGSIKEIGQAENPVKQLVNLYVKFHVEVEDNPDLEDEARSWFKKLEDGDQEARDLWQKCIDWSWQEFSQIYQDLGIEFSQEFDHGRGLGESFFEDKMQDVIDEMRKSGYLKTGEKGAELFFFPGDALPPLMILKKDGSTLYATRDLATDKYRKIHYSPDLIINEVGGEQALYFRQIFQIEKLMGWFADGQRVHVKHGLYRFKDKKMSTRKGNVIWLEEVLTEAKKRAKDLAKASQKSKVKSQKFEKIGIGALKWNDLRRKSELDIIFDWDEILNMEGNSGPYLQYTYARAKSVLNKSNVKNQKSKVGQDGEMEGWGEGEVGFQLNQEERIVLRQLSRFGEVVEKAADEFSPHILCTYLFDLAQSFNTFYAKHSILGISGQVLGIREMEDITNFRLQLTEAVAIVIQRGLKILGIETVEEM